MTETTTGHSESLDAPGLSTHEHGALGSDGSAAQPGQATLICRRFRRHPLALTGAIGLLLAVLLALIGPLIAPVTPALTDFYQRTLTPTTIVGGNFLQRNTPPQVWPLNWRLLMGTDNFGVPILAYTLDGFRPALEIGILASLAASIVGIALGGVAGYFGRFVDAPLMRLADAFLAVPAVPLIMLISAFLLDKGILTYVALFAATGWPGVARLTRNAVSSLREREFAAAARSLGVSDLRLLFRHILPNASSVLIVAFTLNAALFVVAEASLDFLGDGPATVTWGGALASAFYSLALTTGYWWQWMFPAAGLLLIVMALNFVGDGLSDALDVNRWTVTVGERPDSAAEREVRPAPPRWHRRLLASAARIVDLVGWGRPRGAPFGTAFAGLAAVWQPSTIRRSRTWASIDTISAPFVVRAHRGIRRIIGTTAVGAADRAVADMLESLDAMATGLAAMLIVPVLVGVEAVFLIGHSPLAYAPNFSPPASYGGVSALSEYTASPQSGGGWNLFVVDRRLDVVYERRDTHDRTLHHEIVARNGNGADPSMAEGGDRTLGVWVGRQGAFGRLRGAYLGRGGSGSFTLTAGHTDVAHPDVVALPSGGFDVVFQRDVHGHTNLYLAAVRPGARHRGLFRRLTRDPHDDLYPRVVVDGSGALDVLYLEHCCGTSVWQVRISRFDSSGRPLGRTRVLDTVHYAPQNRNGKTLYNAIPPQWGFDLKRADDGSVWVAWSGDQLINLAQFGVRGGFVLRPHAVGPTGGQLELALALMHHGGEVFTASHPNEGSYLAAIPFRSGGRSSGIAERVAFDPRDEAYDPRAGTANGQVAVVWQNVRPGGVALLEGAIYHQALPPDLATRLGLNIGNVWENAVLVVLGSLAGGLVLAVVNAVLVALLILAWVPVSHLPWRRLRWPVYLALAGLLIALLIAAGSPSSVVLIMTGLVAPLEASYRWLAVAGASIVACCVGVWLRRQEPLLRAAGTAFSAIWFIATLYVALAIQVAITRV